jgi:hypothetical protein
MRPASALASLPQQIMALLDFRRKYLANIAFFLKNRLAIFSSRPYSEDDVALKQK